MPVIVDMGAHFSNSRAQREAGGLVALIPRPLPLKGAGVPE